MSPSPRPAHKRGRVDLLRLASPEPSKPQHVHPWRDHCACHGGILTCSRLQANCCAPVFGLKLNQVKRATHSYIRDRTDQATGTVASYAVAAGLFAASGVFLIAALLVGLAALFRWVETHLWPLPGVRRDRRIAAADRGHLRCCGGRSPETAVAAISVVGQPSSRRHQSQSAQAVIVFPSEMIRQRRLPRHR